LLVTPQRPQRDAEVINLRGATGHEPGVATGDPRPLGWWVWPVTSSVLVDCMAQSFPFPASLSG